MERENTQSLSESWEFRAGGAIDVDVQLTPLAPSAGRQAAKASLFLIAFTCVVVGALLLTVLRLNPDLSCEASFRVLRGGGGGAMPFPYEEGAPDATTHSTNEQSCRADAPKSLATGAGFVSAGLVASRAAQRLGLGSGPVAK